MSFDKPDPRSMNKLQQSVALTLDLKFQDFLKNGSPESRLELIRHWHVWNDRHKQTLLKSELVLSEAIRQALYSSDLQVKANAFSATAELLDFELLGDLVKVTTQANYVHRETSGKVLAGLVVELFQHHRKQLVPESDSAAVEYDRIFHWPANRAQLREQLEAAVAGYRNHQRTEILLAYLLFTDYSDPFVKRALTLETHEAHGDLVSLLFESRTQPLIEKLAGYVTVRNPPVKLSRLWSKRSDWPFINAFLTAVSAGTSEVTAANLRRLGKPVWIESVFDRICELDVNQQMALLRIIVAGTPDQDSKLEWMMRVLSVADLPVRRETVREICAIQGIRANKVVSYLVDQEADAESLALLLPEMRKRNIQGSMKRLLLFLDHSNEAVRKAASDSFQDCSIQRYLAAFDMLNEAVRISTGQLVHKVDPNADRVLKEELTCNVRSRRLRALIAVRFVGNAQALQSAILRGLADEDPKIREATAGTLGFCHTIEAQRNLRHALLDEHPKVRKAAERALQKLAGS